MSWKIISTHKDTFIRDFAMFGRCFSEQIMRDLAADFVKTVNKNIKFRPQRRIYCTVISTLICHIQNESIFVDTYYLPLHVKNEEWNILLQE